MNKIITLPPIYYFEIGQKIKAKNSVSDEIFYGKVEKHLPIAHGYIIKTNYDNKLMYFEGKELTIDD